MAYGTYLVKLGSYAVPYELILLESYKVTPDQRQDVDSYRDLNQDLHRNVSSHYKSIVQFKTRPNLREDTFSSLMSSIHDNLKSAKERKIKVSFWNPMESSYGSGDFYWVQPNITILRIEDDGPIYDALEFKFIEY